ncbi:type II toxin-antitoxin system VapC family toxin [Devosia sediminis]|uniref:Ribonuclease VapC n=1 Tax=Devosia sediminis TaxID=2798801 RepID=A0A934MMJ2_9HYPH|nr:type II toxin-antitoxin system VapC family toxin [Devosia sediminis]MBJ3786270.1 type II toxin-antitoxin system VapC family toxin [Devosia sediminis]
MFVDASAVIAILGGEDDANSLVQKLERAQRALMSPLALYETVAGLARKRDCSVEEAQALVDVFIEEARVEVVEISSTIGRAAIAAFAQYGKGRHKADLNMGDCFAYACARIHGVPLLFKGNDFMHTDIDRG